MGDRTGVRALQTLEGLGVAAPAADDPRRVVLTPPGARLAPQSRPLSAWPLHELREAFSRHALGWQDYDGGLARRGARVELAALSSDVLTFVADALAGVWDGQVLETATGTIVVSVGFADDDETLLLEDLEAEQVGAGLGAASLDALRSWCDRSATPWLAGEALPASRGRRVRERSCFLSSRGPLA